MGQLVNQTSFQSNGHGGGDPLCACHDRLPSDDVAVASARLTARGHRCLASFVDGGDLHGDESITPTPRAPPPRRGSASGEWHRAAAGAAVRYAVRSATPRPDRRSDGAARPSTPTHGDAAGSHDDGQPGPDERPIPRLGAAAPHRLQARRPAEPQGDGPSHPGAPGASGPPATGASCPSSRRRATARPRCWPSGRQPMAGPSRG